MRKYYQILILLSLILFTGCPSGTHTIGNKNSKPNRYISSIAQCDEGEYKFLARGEQNSNTINLFSLSINEQKLEKTMSFELNNSNDVVFSNIFCQNQNIYVMTQSPNRKIEIDSSKKVTIETIPNRGFMINPSEILVCDIARGSECFYKNREDNLKISYSSLPSIDMLLEELNSTVLYYDQEVDIYPYIEDKKWDKKTIFVSFQPKEDNPKGYLVLLEYQNNQWYIRDNTKAFYLLHKTDGYPIYLSDVQYYNFKNDYVGIFESLPRLDNPNRLMVQNHKLIATPTNMNYSIITKTVFDKTQGKNNHNENITPTLDDEGNLFFVFIKDDGLDIELYDTKSDTSNMPIKFHYNEKVF